MLPDSKYPLCLNSTRKMTSLGSLASQTNAAHTSASYESGADAWTRVSAIVRKVDEDKIRDYKEDIDTILVFVSLTFILCTVLR